VALVAPGAVLAACSSDSDSGGSPSSPGGSTGGAAKPGGALAKVSDVPVGGGIMVDDGGRKLLLVQPKAGTVKAFDPTCPHQGFTVKPPSGGTILCPGHGSTFDAASGALKTGPATKGLAEVAVKVSGGNVIAA
jgi:nitrite reductase/ring-hydroxylating ferredoxin subunit